MNISRALLFVLLFFSSVSAAVDYAALHDLVIRFYGYQRAGLKSGSANNLNSGFTNAAHSGDNYNGTPLDGGWYDAGDYIKFGMPLSYAVYCLLKGCDIFPSAYADKYKQDNSSGADGIPDVLNQVKYATDYLMKAVINQDTIILDVGQAAEEHKGLDDPMINAGGRDASRCLTCSGADIPAAYSACLALMSTLYRKFDPKYADSCLAKAKIAFKFAKKKIDQGGDNNLFCKAQQKAGAYLYYYFDVGDGKLQRQIGDKMAAAGVELYRATDDEDPEYKAWAKHGISEVYNCMSYSFIGPLASYEVWHQGLGSASSVIQNVGFVEGMIQTTGVFKNVYKNSGEGTARDVAAAAFVYALGYVTTSGDAKRTDYKTRVVDHIAWMTGSNSLNKSFVIGFGSSYPTSIHYRTTASGPKGGVVSGPDGDGNWANDRSAAYCEVALDFNAGITGAVAFLKALENPGADIQVKTAFSATPEGEIDLTSNAVTFKAGFSKSVACTLTITGGSGTKTFTGNGTDISMVWDGSADHGMFLSGETVAARLTFDGNVAAYDILRVKALKLFIAKAKKLLSSKTDVPLDDFTDGDSANLLGGTWFPTGNLTTFAGRTNIIIEANDGGKQLRIAGTIESDARSTYAGARTTFNQAGIPQSIGPSKTVAFDCHANKETRLTVELEQPDITDSAWYGMTVPVTTMANSYRLDIAEFRQPEWKSVDRPLNRNVISAVRFTMFDSTGMTSLYLDNVSIDSLSTAAFSRVLTPSTAYFNPVVKGSALHYVMPRTPGGVLECNVFDVAGKVVLRRTVTARPGMPVMMSLADLPSGMYSVMHTSGGVPAGEMVRFFRVR